MWNLDDKKVRAEMAKTIPFSNVLLGMIWSISNKIYCPKTNQRIVVSSKGGFALGTKT